MNFHRKRKDCEPTSWATRPGTKSIWPVLRNQKQWLMWDFPLDPLGLLLQVTRHLPTNATSCIGGGGGGRVTDTPAYKCQGHRWRFLALFNVSWQTYIPLPPALPAAGTMEMWASQGLFCPQTSSGLVTVCSPSHCCKTRERQDTILFTSVHLPVAALQRNQPVVPPLWSWHEGAAVSCGVK